MPCWTTAGRFTLRQIMDKTFVRVGGYGGQGGYGFIFSSRTIASSSYSSRRECSGLRLVRYPVFFACDPRQLGRIVCRSSVALFRSASFSFTGFPVPRLAGERSEVSGFQRIMADMTTEAPTSEERVPVKTMKVVDHIVLFKMKVDDLQEKEMLDGLYSLQYAIKDIICCSVGPLTVKTPEGYTHGLFTRFKSVQACKDYFVHEKKVEVAEQLVIPFFSETPGICMVDFETEVENDLEAVFRRGDRFESGVEHFLMFKFKDGTAPEKVEESLNVIKSVRAKFGDGIVQTTVGVNFEPRTMPYLSHGVVTRFESESSFREFEKFLSSQPVWASVKNLTENHIEGSFIVEPVGNKLM